jgi:hypothetical protein
MQEGYNQIGWNQEALKTTLHFTIESETGYLKEIDQRYICINLFAEWLAPYQNRILLCDPEMFELPVYRHISCEQMPDAKLVCSTPAVSCIIDESTWEFDCRDLGGEFNQFYTDSIDEGDFLAMGSNSNLPPGLNIHPVELNIIKYEG